MYGALLVHYRESRLQKKINWEISIQLLFLSVTISVKILEWNMQQEKKETNGGSLSHFGGVLLIYVF
jgi:hypothetical protein